MIRSKYFLITGLLFLIQLIGNSQTIKGYTDEQVNEFSTKVEDQVRFLEYLLNTIGNGDTSPRDKDVIIRESYLKIFRDEKVQVEDDLLLDRKVVTNKDVTAYLKDIEFFYKNVEFNYKIRDVKPAQKESGEVYFLASLDRTFTATSLSGEKITNTKPRFVEVNLDEKSQELKIVSVYTTKVSRDEELTAWWESLDFPWQSYFLSRFDMTASDSVSLDSYYRFVSVDSLDISGNTQITTLSPLSELRDLKVVNISSTGITDLSPISNVTFLEILDISNTPTSDIQFIKYADRLKHLDISNTQIQDISQLLNLKNLISLKAENTPILSFSVLNEFKQLKKLDLTESGFNNIENIKELNNLETLDLSGNYMINLSSLTGLIGLRSLDLSHTNIQDLSSLSALEKLEYLDITASPVADISSLGSLGELKKVLADETQLSPVAADAFVRNNPGVLLIHHIKDVESWWSGLSDEWKNALKRNNPAIESDRPSIEILTQTITLPKLKLNASELDNLIPITRFVNLSYLDISDNPISDLLPLSEVRTLVTLLGKNTQIIDLSPLEENDLLDSIDLEFSPVQSIGSIVSLPELSYLNVNGGDVDSTAMPDFMIRRPDLNIVYRTEELNSWWKELDSSWKDYFRKYHSISENPDSEELHLLAAQPELIIQNVSISSLIPLSVFVNLRKLEVFDVPVSSAAPLSGFRLLTQLRLSQVPVVDFLPLSGLDLLEDLDLSNTGIESLAPLSNLSNLKTLNISGTNLKTLKGLEALFALEELDVASTNLRNLKPIDGLHNLKKLVCFNTNLSSRAVETFKSNHPDCEVRFY